VERARVGVIRVERIGRGHELYEQSASLRERVLLEPIGYTRERFEREYPGFEDAEHIVAVIDHPAGERVVGTATLVAGYPEEGVGKLTQMAVDPQRRREGIGRRLVVELEQRAFLDHRLRLLFCHAQLDAVPFYEALGWETEGEVFEEAGIEHFRMVVGGSDAASTARTGGENAEVGDDDEGVLGV
jgi:predicted GNAT family N-acyltransferase